jgi:hypothetical protein
LLASFILQLSLLNQPFYIVGVLKFALLNLNIARIAYNPLSRTYLKTEYFKLACIIYKLITKKLLT